LERKIVGFIGGRILCGAKTHNREPKSFCSAQHPKLPLVTLPTVAGQYSPNQIGFLQHRVGDRIKDRYDVLERLGGGNFGSVYRVVDTAVGNVLACKEMHVLDTRTRPSTSARSALDLFKREALNLARCVIPTFLPRISIRKKAIGACVRFAVDV
jgi:hypothetical protein